MPAEKISAVMPSSLETGVMHLTEDQSSAGCKTGSHRLFFQSSALKSTRYYPRTFCDPYFTSDAVLRDILRSIEAVAKKKGCEVYAVLTKGRVYEKHVGDVDGNVPVVDIQAYDKSKEGGRAYTQMAQQRLKVRRKYLSGC